MAIHSQLSIALPLSPFYFPNQYTLQFSAHESETSLDSHAEESPRITSRKFPFKKGMILVFILPSTSV
jgi:hypothetical protein